MTEYLTELLVPVNSEHAWTEFIKFGIHEYQTCKSKQKRKIKFLRGIGKYWYEWNMNCRLRLEYQLIKTFQSKSA